MSFRYKGEFPPKGLFVGPKKHIIWENFLKMKVHISGLF